MAKGQRSGLGDTRTAPNGYHYTRTTTGWKLTHHLTAEKRLGRPLRKDERCRFKDNDRTNFNDPENILVYTKKEQSKGSRRAQIEAKIEQLQSELADLND